MTVSSEVVRVPHAEAEVGPHAPEGGINTALLGMLLFIGSELMFFAGLFGAYFSARAQAAEWPPEPFGHVVEPNLLVVSATIILVLSSFTMHWGVMRIRKGDRTGLNRAVAVTLILGVIFLLMQAADYYILVVHEGFGINSTVYGTLFFTLTGFHGAHVFGGVVGLAVILLRGGAGQFSRRHHIAVEAVSAYWHFVDVVWIALFAVLYLMH
jgi:cytochrome c oxidase subunit III